jgi:pre-rRNA-processing protein TSR4
MERTVLIGIPEERVEIPAEEGVTKIGGVPRWLCGEPPNFLPNKCQSCGHDMVLIVSADCPVSPGYDRILYVYICPKCGSSAKCFRQKVKSPELTEDVIAPPLPVEPEAEEETKEEKPKAVSDLKPVSATSLMAALSALDDEPVVPKKQNPPKGKGKEKKPKKQYEKGYYPAYYVDIFEEPEEELDPSVKFVMASSADSTGSTPGFLEEDTADVDPILVEYNARIQREPEQVLRYCRGGEPLLQDKIRINVPKCPKCGGERIFELEVIPTIISKLDPENFDIDFGPILIYTCSKDCGEGSSEEHVIVCPP